LREAAACRLATIQDHERQQKVVPADRIEKMGTTEPRDNRRQEIRQKMRHSLAWSMRAASQLVGMVACTGQQKTTVGVATSADDAPEIATRPVRRRSDRSAEHHGRGIMSVARIETSGTLLPAKRTSRAEGPPFAFMTKRDDVATTVMKRLL